MQPAPAKCMSGSMSPPERVSWVVKPVETPEEQDRRHRGDAKTLIEYAYKAADADCRLQMATQH
jgi:hypothetical protein